MTLDEAETCAAAQYSLQDQLASKRLGVIGGPVTPMSPADMAAMHKAQADQEAKWAAQEEARRTQELRAAALGWAVSTCGQNDPVTVVAAAEAYLAFLQGSTEIKHH